MTEDRPTRAPHAPCAPQGPAPAPGEGAASPDAPAGHTAPRGDEPPVMNPRGKTGPRPRIAALLPQIEQMLDDGNSYEETARTLQISTATIRRYLPGRSQWTRRDGGVFSSTCRTAAREADLPPLANTPTKFSGTLETRRMQEEIRDRLTEALDTCDGSDTTALIETLLPVVEHILAVKGARSLTAREREMISLAVTGEPTRTIAGRMGIGECAVRNYLRLAVDKLGAQSRQEAVDFLLRHGLVDGRSGEWNPDIWQECR